MKTSAQLVQEIDAMAAQFGQALLVIGFARKNRVVGMEFPKARLKRLEELLSKGGVPIAFLSKQRTRGVPCFYYRLLDELASETWAELFMITFIDHMYRCEAGEIPTDIGIEKFKRLLDREKKHRNN